MRTRKKAITLRLAIVLTALCVALAFLTGAISGGFEAHRETQRRQRYNLCAASALSGPEEYIEYSLMRCKAIYLGD